MTKMIKDNKFLRNTFTVLVVIAAYAAAIVYFGIFKDLDLDSVVLIDTGALTIIGLFAIKAIRWDVTQRAFLDENTNNKELIKVNDDIVEENKKVINDVYAQDCVDEHNVFKQNLANIKLTSDRLTRLRKNLRRTRIRNKLPWWRKYISSINTKEDLIKSYEEQIKVLEANPAFDNKYVSVKLDDIMNVGDLALKKTIAEHKKYKYDPRKDAWWSIFFSLFKFVGIGATSIPFAINSQDWDILIPYYITLTITALITVIRRYLSIIKRTGEVYLQTRRDKLNFLRKINEYITTKEAADLVIQHQIETDKAVIIRKDKDVVFEIDGNMHTVNRKDFINLAESLCGFGKTVKLAYEDLLKQEKLENQFKKLYEDLELHFKNNNDSYVIDLNHMDLESLKIIDRIAVKGYIVKLVESKTDKVFEIKTEVKVKSSILKNKDKVEVKESDIPNWKKKLQ